MRFHLSTHLMLKIKYVFHRGDSCYWQRKVPTDLVERYPSSGPLKVNLQTTDPRVVSAKVARLNREHEALWAAMRKDPSLTPHSARDAAGALLKSHGLPPTGREPDEDALSAFYDLLDDKRAAYATRQGEPEDVYTDAPLSAFLSKPEVDAVRLLSGASCFLLSDAVEVYLQEHPKRGQDGFVTLETYTHRVWAKLMKTLGDKVFTEVTREDAKAFRDQLLALVKTESARRNINVVRAVFTKAIAEKSLTIPNVWDRLTVAGLGTDSTPRESLTPEQLSTLRALCHAKDDDIRWALAIQLDTGSRIGEVVGLRLGDIHLHGEVPHVIFREYSGRTLKTKNSTRVVPLVGDALWGAQRVVESAATAQRHAFPRYIADGLPNANSASAALNKWMRLADIPKTTHELRHTMADRLRNSGATKDIQESIGGWGKNAMIDNYGLGYALQMMREAMLKTLPGVD
ncbi:MAG: tyrosine-type recombinase/integrase [Thiobacillus sp.]|nr:tyrosine-type recombinase/integrase [Thiobacillus sp.]